MRVTTNSAAFDEMSIPTHDRCRRSAATNVVAHPQKGSNTTSPGSLLASDDAFKKGNEASAWDSRFFLWHRESDLVVLSTHYILQMDAPDWQADHRLSLGTVPLSGPIDEILLIEDIQAVMHALYLPVIWNEVFLRYIRLYVPVRGKSPVIPNCRRILISYATVVKDSCLVLFPDAVRSSNTIQATSMLYYGSIF